MEFSIAIRSIKTPTDANYITTLTFGANVDYQKITGRVYNFKKVSEGKDENDKYGYWSATAELTNLINPFTNPITNTVVAETKIEIVFNDIHGWGASVIEKDYFQYLADSAGNLIIARYNQLYGVAIKLLISPEEAKPKDTGPIPELSFKYISHVDAEAGVTKVTFEIYEVTGSDSNGPILSLLGKLEDFSPFEMDQTTKKISILLSDIDKVKVVSSKIAEWLDKYQTNLPKDAKYVLQGYPVETKKEVTTETKTVENKNVDNTAINLAGEFTFDVQEDDLFKGINNQFPVLEIIGKGEIKETPIEYLENNEVVSEDDYMDEEYQEEDYQGLNELDIIVVDSTINEIIMNTEELEKIKGNDPENPNPDLSTDGKYPISKDTDGNIKKIIEAAKSGGITNKFTIAAILAICKKESGFIPKSETSYKNTAAAKYNKQGKIVGGIKNIFSVFKKYTDAEVDVIKKDDKKFFDIVYGGKYGNEADEGYKYRGRGFNQITFKGSDKNPMSGYRKYKVLTGIDLVSDPDQLNKVEVAAVCLIEYFKSNIDKAPSDSKTRYNFTDINSFKSLEDATGAIYHANAGFGKSYSSIIADSTGGRAKSFKYVGPLYNTYLKDKA
jgi:predicted chitinase